MKAVSNVRPTVRAYVCSYIKRFFDFNDIWHVGRGRCDARHVTTVCSMIRSRVKVTSP